MAFNFLHFITLYFLISCASGSSQKKNPDGKSNMIGDTLQTTTDVILKSNSLANVFALADAHVKRVHVFNLEDLSLKFSYLSSAESDATRNVISDLNGNYVVDLSTKHIEVINKEGSQAKNPFKFQGTPNSAAFHSTDGYLVVYDSLKSVGILKLSAQGKIEGSVLLGPLVGENQSISSGEISDDGKLILSISDKSLIIVNLAETLAKQEWIYDTLDLKLDHELDWLTPIKDSNLILATSSEEILLIDYVDLNIKEKISIKNLSINRFKGIHPHIYITGTDQQSIIYVNSDLTLVQHELTFLSSDLAKIKKSYLNLDQLLLRGLFQSDIIALRLKDNLILLNEKTPAKANSIDLCDECFVISYDSPLGKIEKYFDDEKKEKITKTGFNLKYLSE